MRIGRIVCCYYCPHTFPEIDFGVPFLSLASYFLIFICNATRLVALYELKFEIENGFIISVRHFVNMFGCCYQLPLCLDCYLLIFL